MGTVSRHIEKMVVSVAYLLTAFFGIALALAAALIQFPIGCNSTGFTCYINPISWWMTFWPNFVTIDVGFFLLSIGAFRATLPAPSSLSSTSARLHLPIGFGLLLSGLILVLPGMGVGFNDPIARTSCPATGCPPPTFQQWWSTYWPNYAALSLGVSLLLVGTLLILVGAGVAATIRSRISRSRRPATGGGGVKDNVPNSSLIQPSSLGHRRLRRLGFYLCFIFGVVALILGELGAPFPPPLLGQTYYSQVDLRSMLLVSPFLLTTGFLLAGSAINSQEAVEEEESPKEGRENISNVTRSNR